MMKLVAELLDKQVRDTRNRCCGKVDGIVLQIGDGAPRVVAIELGSLILARRLGRRAARVAAWWVRLLGDRAAGSSRVAWAHIVRIGLHVELDLDAEHEPLLRAERWLRDRVVARLPGGRE